MNVRGKEEEVLSEGCVRGVGMGDNGKGWCCGYLLISWDIYKV